MDELEQAASAAQMWFTLMLLFTVLNTVLLLGILIAVRPRRERRGPVA